MNRFYRRSFVSILMFCILITTVACATIKVNPGPVPPPTAKLRVVVQAFSGPGINASISWTSSHEFFEKNTVGNLKRFLDETGIYSIVADGEVRKALFGQRVSVWDVEQNNWMLARELGRALHADYYLMTERFYMPQEGTGCSVTVRLRLVNVESASAFSGRAVFPCTDSTNPAQRMQDVFNAYRQLFDAAKSDMLATAVKKSRIVGPLEVAKSEQPARPAVVTPEPKKQATPPVLQKPEPKPETPPQPVPKSESQSVPAPQKSIPTVVPKEEIPPAGAKQTQPAMSASKTDTPPVAKAVPNTVPMIRKPDPNLPASGLIESPKKDTNSKKIVVYDFDANDQYRTVALILAEALREEVFKLKEFILVNREDLQKVLEEMALQQTGLIDEKEAVRTGKGLAASQVVTGRLGQLGKIFLMQAKRVDVETFGTLGLASIRFTEGQEEEALNKLPDFARTLTGPR